MVAKNKRIMSKSLKGFWQTASGKSLFVLLLLLSILLMLIDSVNPNSFAKTRNVILDYISIAYQYASAPIESYHYWRDQTSAVINIFEENQRLKIENQTLQQWRFEASRLMLEMQELQRMTNLKSYPQKYFITAKIISSNHHSFQRSIIINTGLKDGVALDDVAVNESGLVGRVTSLGDDYSVILLLNDVNSQIPVRVPDTGARAILQGDNQYKPKLTFVQNQNNITDGQLIVTSQHGGIYPAGIPVGYSVIDDNNIIRTDTFLAQDDLVYVHIIKSEKPIIK